MRFDEECDYTNIHFNCICIVGPIPFNAQCRSDIYFQWFWDYMYSVCVWSIIHSPTHNNLDSSIEDVQGTFFYHEQFNNWTANKTVTVVSIHYVCSSEKKLC